MPDLAKSSAKSYNLNMEPFEKRFLRSALLINGLCLGLFFLRILATGVSRYWFIPENLLLAWLALLFGWLLVKYVGRKSWRSWQAILLSVFWLVFLPNAWYVMTDFLHLANTGEISQLYDIGLLVSLVASGFLAGFTSLILVHRQLLRRLGSGASALAVAAVILFASFAIYLGRDLRWNSWDIIANPGGLALNVSDRLIDPFGQPRMFDVSGLFFVIIGAGYAAVWQLAKPRS